MPVNFLKEVNDWRAIWRDRDASPLDLVFKHSTRCPVSASAEDEFRRFAEDAAPGIGMHLVDVLVDRGLSLRIADDTGVVHKSPQALLIGPGPRVLWQASHWDITRQSLAAAVEGALRKSVERS